MEFLCSFLRRHFAGKPVVASQNVGCFLRLVLFTTSELATCDENSTLVRHISQALSDHWLCNFEDDFKSDLSNWKGYHILPCSLSMYHIKFLCGNNETQGLGKLSIKSSDQRMVSHKGSTLYIIPGGVLPPILDRGVPRRFVNPNPI